MSIVDAYLEGQSVVTGRNSLSTLNLVGCTMSAKSRHSNSLVRSEADSKLRTGPQPELLVPVTELLEARVIFAAAPAMGHNQVLTDTFLYTSRLSTLSNTVCESEMHMFAVRTIFMLPWMWSRLFMLFRFNGSSSLIPLVLSFGRRSTLLVKWFSIKAIWSYVTSPFTFHKL